MHLRCTCFHVPSASSRLTYHVLRTCIRLRFGDPFKYLILINVWSFIVKSRTSYPRNKNPSLDIKMMLKRCQSDGMLRSHYVIRSQKVTIFFNRIPLTAFCLEKDLIIFTRKECYDQNMSTALKLEKVAEKICTNILSFNNMWEALDTPSGLFLKFKCPLGITFKRKLQGSPDLVKLLKS